MRNIDMSKVIYACLFVTFFLSSSANSKDNHNDHVPGDTQTLDEYKHLISVEGNANKQVNNQIRGLNKTMRDNYMNILNKVSLAIDPVIVVQFEGVGGTFNLRDGNRHITATPVPETYELAKSIAHSPLGVYVILAPFLQTPESTLWRHELKKYGSQIQSVLDNLDKSSLIGDARENARIVLKETNKFIAKALKKG